MEVKITFTYDDYKALASQLPKNVPYISGRATLSNGEHTCALTISMFVYPDGKTTVVWWDIEFKDGRGTMTINNNFDIAKFVEAYENSVR
ncbi:MAG: hypothetical protein IIU75_04795 [Rikenellaceae bacterium]|nr:hypothetical protein [Alistipes sp.]MBQ5596376.1 hypothetical protein [Rikenellaceae bacterium]